MPEKVRIIAQHEFFAQITKPANSIIKFRLIRFSHRPIM